MRSQIYPVGQSLEDHVLTAHGPQGKSSGNGISMQCEEELCNLQSFSTMEKLPEKGELPTPMNRQDCWVGRQNGTNENTGVS